jgi:hypothetical protein
MLTLQACSVRAFADPNFPMKIECPPFPEAGKAGTFFPAWWGMSKFGKKRGLRFSSKPLIYFW